MSDQKNDVMKKKYAMVLSGYEIAGIADFIDMAVKAYGVKCNLGLANNILVRLDKDPMEIASDPAGEKTLAKTPEKVSLAP